MTMDKKFVNEYNYTSEDIQEITAVWWKNRHRNNFPAAVFLFVIAVLIIAMAMTGFKAMTSIVTVLLIAFIICIPGLRILRAFRDGRELRAKFDTLEAEYGPNPKVRIKVDENIREYVGGSVITVPFDEVEKILPTENFLVIIARRDPILALRTDSFIEGDWGSFHSFMAEKLSRR